MTRDIMSHSQSDSGFLEFVPGLTYKTTGDGR